MPFNRYAAMRKLHILGNTHGYDHDALRDLAVSLFHLPADRRSLTKLSNGQLCDFIRHLSGSPLSADQATVTTAGPTVVANLASSRQIWLIRQLATQAGMDSNPDRLPGFIARQCKGKRDLQQLAVWEAGRVIDGLKNLLNPARSHAPAQPLPTHDHHQETA